jgi:hypothetical protein
MRVHTEEEPMSFAEKRLWIELAASLAVWGVYFTRLIGWIDAGGLQDPEFAATMGGHFVLAVAAGVAIRVVLSLIARRVTPRAELRVRDEREDLAALRATFAGHALLGGLVLGVAAVGYVAGVTGHVDIVPISAEGMVVLANLTLGALVQAELLRLVVHLILLRRPG